MELVDGTRERSAIREGSGRRERQLRRELRRPRLARPILAQPRDRARERQHLGRRAKLPNALDERPVRGGEHMERPRRLGMPQAGDDIEKARLRSAELSRRSEVHHAHGEYEWLKA
jgi:hypothetical protein